MGKRKERYYKNKKGALFQKKSVDQIVGDAWISCQADVNKLVKKRRPKKGSLFDPDESWPEEKTIPFVTTVTEEPATLTTATTDEPSETDNAFEYKINIEDIEPSPEEIEKKLDTDEVGLAVADAKDVVPAPLEEWEIKKQLCRCCLVEGIFDSLHSPAPGDDITYDDMLMQCFNIELFPVSSDVTAALRGVCGLCATRLRDAHAFRHQVSATEARFRDLYTRDCITVTASRTATVEINLQPETSDIDDDNREILPPLLEERSKFDARKNGNAKAPAKPRAKRKKICISTKKFTPTNEFVWADDAYKCTQCEESFTLLSDLRKHFRKTHVPNASKYRNRKYTADVPANEYVQTDDGYKCKKCEIFFENLQSLQAHFSLVHPELLTFSRRLTQKCKLCDNSFLTKTQLRKHEFIEHNIDHRFKCGACDKAYYTKEKLAGHIKGYHMMGEKIKCSLCDYESFIQNNVRNHMVKHKTSKDFHCKYCKKSFLRKSTLQLHEKIHTGDKRKACAECGEAFVQKASLNYHMTKYHPEVKF